MLRPSEFFEKIAAPETSLTDAFQYYAIVSLILLAGQILLVALVGISFLQLFSLFGGTNLLGLQTAISGFLLVISIVMAVVGYIIGLISTFIGAAIIHLSAKLLKGNGNYAASYKAVTYSSTPSLLIGWIPFVGIIAAFYSIYVLIVGISKLHQMSMARAFAVILIPAAIVVAIVIVSVMLGSTMGASSMYKTSA